MDLSSALFLFLAAVVAGRAEAAVRGIDVSYWQGAVNWAKVKAAGISFAIAKATEGAAYEDPTFLNNIRAIKAQGMQAGAYHYFKGGVSAAAQVNVIYGLLSSSTFDQRSDVLAIDVEQGGNEGVSADKMASTLYTLLTELKRSYRNVFIYTGPSYWENKVSWKNYDFSLYPLWIAHYTSASAPTVPSTWKNKGKSYTWWQYTDKGTVNGVSGHVDMNKAN